MAFHSFTRRAGAVLGVAALAASIVVVAPAALINPSAVVSAAGSPDISLTASMPSETLFGEPTTVTLTATNPAGPDGFNLSFRDRLPAGSSLISSSIPPTQTITDGSGRLVLIWENVADLQTGTTESITYSFLAPTPTFDIGNIVSDDAGAYVNTDARFVPDFDPVTGDATTDVTGFDTATASTTLVPFEITKAEPSPEAELLRGVHDHKTVYTLTVQNNSELATSGFVIEDYLPAGLEFLGCTAADNTAPAVEEYTGSGRIDASFPTFTNPCVVPSTVETVTVDPVGALPLGVYTHVVWTATDLTAGLANQPPSGTFSIDYAAAVPLRENVMFPGGTPTSGVQGSNLDNNAGALTTDEQALTNQAAVTGTTNGNVYTDRGEHTVTAEDLAVQKSVDLDTISQGQISTWTMQIETSEYAVNTSSITMDDITPDGLCVIAAGTACAGSGAPPAPAPTTVVGTGPTTVHWDLADLGASQVTTVEMRTLTDADYSGSNPVSTNDTWTNTVSMDATATVITDSSAATADVPVVDDSAADQLAGGVELIKEVAERDPVTASCGDGSTLAWTAGIASEYRAGDRVCWRVRINFDNALDTLEVTLRDMLPPGQTFEGWQFGANNNVAPGDVGFTATGVPPTWTMPTVDAGSQVLEVVLASIVTAPTAADGDILANLAKLSYENTAGEVFQERDQADVEMSAPAVTLIKGVATVNGVATPGAPADNVQVQATDTVTYNVIVDNPGTLDVDAMSVRDLLPTGITCASDVVPLSISDSGTCNVDRIDWSAISIAAGASKILSYQVVVPAGAAASQSYTNTAGVRQFDVPTNTGTPMTYVPTDNIDGTLIPNTTEAIDTSRIFLASPLISKTRTTSVAETGNTAAQATIGETISYTISVTVPAMTTVYDARVTDTVSNRLDVVNPTLAATRDGGALPGTFTLGSVGNAITLDFPATYANATASNQVIAITFDALVLDVAANDRDAGAVGNTGSFRYENQTGTPTTINANVNTTIVEPNIHITKTNADADGRATPDEVIDYNLAVTNPSVQVPPVTGVSNAYDVTVVDVVPVNLDPVLPIPDGGVWDPTPGVRTITWTIATVAVNATVNRPYQATVLNPLIATETLENTATVRATSMAGSISGERDSTSPNGGGTQGYLDSDTNSLDAPELAIAKSASPTTATLGETITYTLDVTIPANVILNDVTVVDDPPAGMEYTDTTSAICITACSPAISVTNLGSDGGRVGWYLDDLDPAASATRVVRIIYTAYAAAPLGDGDTAQNSVVVAGNSTDVIGAPPSSPPNPASFDVVTTPDTADVDIVEPTLVIDKDVTGQVGDTDQRRAIPGEELTFTVAVTNSGTSAAYDVDVTDTPDDRLLLGTVADGTGYTVTDGDPSDSDLAWAIAGPIAPGATVTITYSLQVPPAFDESEEVPGFELTNSADVPSYLGVALADQEPDNDYVDYNDVTPDVVQVELDLASIGNRIWWDLDDDGIQDADEPGFAGVDVTVLYLGPNGVLGGGDDESHTATTDANGDYLVEDLPGGSYRVTVDTADLPAGFVAVYDLDNGLIAPNSVWAGTLAQDAAKRDVDFGYDGQGSIGDTIWFDANADGIPDPGEPGLAGVDVTVTWLGPNGVAGGGDDRTFPTTTDSTGSYLVSDLPAGAFTVIVDDGTLPSEFTAQTGDPDATFDHSSALTLAPGATNLLQDFGYAGTGSIGDTVWFDRNNDGTRDLDDDGIPGVTVTLTWHGPDGVAGGGDDVDFTRTTDATGSYLFENLPAGSYVVVASGLPPDYLNTYDEDGDLDSSVAVALTDGDAHLTADFGYNGDTAIGDRVWWDINGDGVQDADEPGLVGIEITTTFAGPNGSFGDSDDLVFTSTTGIDGEYLVPNAPEGEYTVEVTGGVPLGMAETYDEDSSTTSPDGVTAVTLGATPHLTADFGYSGTGSIGDLVYLDHDGDGTFGAGDQGLAGIDVTLTWAGPDEDYGTPDDITLDTVTDATGTYLFTGLPAGEFRVTLDDADLPPGLTPTADPDGGDDHTSAVTLASGATDTAQDFGYDGTGSIGDTIWLDLDGDGLRDVGEPGLPEIDVTLVWAGIDGAFGTPDDVTFTGTTDSAGEYRFNDLPAGPYRVAVDAADLPAGLVPSADPDGGADNGSALTLAAGADDSAQDFAYVGDASVGDRVWIDVDNDGLQDAAEPAAPGLPVTVTAAGLDGAFGTADDIVIELVTDAQGEYLALGLPAGDVRVAYDNADLPDGYTPGTDLDGGDATVTTVTLAFGDAPRDVDFGIVGTAALAGVVWNDLDADGVRDPGETGIGDVTVTAVWAGPDGPVPLTVVTGPDGAWSIASVPPGSYTVTVTQTTVPTDLVPSTPVTVTVLVPAGGLGTVEHGETPSALIGNHIWLDTNRDGVRDAGEPGIANVTVRLQDSNGVTVATTATDSSGQYLFSGLVPGTYRVVVDTDTLPASYQQYGDPDAILNGWSEVTVGPGEDNVGQNFSFAPPPVPVTAPAAEGIGDPMAWTGANVMRGLGFGLALLGTGALLTALARRRRGTGYC